MSCIEKAGNLITQTLSPAGFNYSQILDSQKPEYKLRSILITKCTPIYDLINESLIIGEYVLDDFEDKIKEVIDKTKSILLSLTLPIDEDGSIEGLEKLLNFEFYPCIEALQFALSNYEEVHSYYEDIFLNTSTPYYKVLSRIEKKVGVENYQSFIDFFTLNIHLTITDLRLSTTQKTLDDLSEIYINRILGDKLSSHKYLNILKWKCELLIHKVAISQVNEYEKDEFKIKINSKEIDFLEFDNPIIQQYSEKVKKADSYKKRGLNQSTISLVQSANKLEDFYIAIRHLKEEEENLEGSRKLIDQFKELYNKKDNTLTSFNNKAWKISFNYLINCHLSLAIHLNNNNHELIEKEFREIIAIQNDTQVFNYFPYYKYCNYLLDDILNILALENPNFELIKLRIKDYEKFNKLLQKHYYWGRDRSFVPYQYSYEECCIKINDKSNNVFIKSSVPPINFDKLQKQHEEVKIKALEIKNFINVRERIYTSEVKITDAENNLKQNNIKQIEILGVFAAIVIFASAQFSALPQLGMTKVSDFIKVTSVISGSLIAFVFMIYLIFNGTNKKGTVIPLWIMAASTFLGLIALLIKLFVV